MSSESRIFMEARILRGFAELASTMAVEFPSELARKVRGLSKPWACSISERHSHRAASLDHLCVRRHELDAVDGVSDGDGKDLVI